MGRSPCCDKNGLKKGPWTPEEDAKLVHYIHLHGPGNWRNLPKNAELKRCGKSCRLRWTNYLRPDIKRGRFSFDEEETIIQLHSVLGNKWSTIAARLPGRTDNEIKNYWNTHIRKRLVQMGLDPVTHAPRLDPLNCSVPSLLNLSSLLGSQSLVNPQLVLLRQLVTSTLFSQLQQQDQQNQFYNTLLQNQIIPTNDVSTDQGFSMDQISKQLTMQNNNIDQSGLVNSNNTSLSRSSISSAHENNVIPYSTSLMGNNDLVSQLPSYVQCNSNPTWDHDLYPENSYLNQTSLDDGNKNFNLESVMSTPLSSPTPSTYINSSSTDQDDQQSYCSNLFKFEIPESDFDISDFL